MGKIRLGSKNNTWSSINIGVLIEQVTASLGSDLPASAFLALAEVFADGFETGNTDGWSSVAP
jgi:hypothetical protein